MCVFQHTSAYVSVWGNSRAACSILALKSAVAHCLSSKGFTSLSRYTAGFCRALLRMCVLLFFRFVQRAPVRPRPRRDWRIDSVSSCSGRSADMKKIALTTISIRHMNRSSNTSTTRCAGCLRIFQRSGDDRWWDLFTENDGEGALNDLTNMRPFCGSS